MSSEKYNFETDAEFSPILKMLKKFDNNANLPPQRAEKCWAFYHLAKEAHSGVIVELGAWHGFGATALWYGSQAGYSVPVYTVDIFQENRGWANELYTREDHKVFWENVQMAKASPNLVIGEFVDLAKDWDKPISLLVFDGSSDMFLAISAWERHVVPGGVIALRDTAQQVLGSKNTINYLLKHNFASVTEMPGYIISTTRKVS